jgi:hypothetical protein
MDNKGFHQLRFCAVPVLYIPPPSAPVRRDGTLARIHETNGECGDRLAARNTVFIFPVVQSSNSLLLPPMGSEGSLQFSREQCTGLSLESI